MPPKKRFSDKEPEHFSVNDLCGRIDALPSDGAAREGKLASSFASLRTMEQSFVTKVAIDKVHMQLNMPDAVASNVVQYSLQQLGNGLSRCYMEHKAMGGFFSSFSPDQAVAKLRADAAKAARTLQATAKHDEEEHVARIKSKPRGETRKR